MTKHPHDSGCQADLLKVWQVFASEDPVHVIQQKSLGIDRKYQSSSATTTISEVRSNLSFWQNSGPRCQICTDRSHMINFKNHIMTR